MIEESLKTLLNLPSQISLSFRFGKLLDRVSQHSPRHLFVMPFQELFFELRIAVAHRPQHPAHGLVNQVFFIRKQYFRDLESVDILPVFDETIGGYDRDTPLL